LANRHSRVLQLGSLRSLLGSAGAFPLLDHMLVAHVRLWLTQLIVSSIDSWGHFGGTVSHDRAANAVDVHGKTDVSKYLEDELDRCAGSALQLCPKGWRVNPGE
jgi:hypothetical protein